MPAIDPSVMLDPNWEPDYYDEPAYEPEPEPEAEPAADSVPEGVDLGLASMLQGAFGGGVSFESADDE